MGKVDGSISNLIQGVSQQPVRDRLEGQGQEQINYRSSAVDGLVRRPGTNYVAKLDLTVPVTKQTCIYTYDRGDAEKYRMYINSGSVEVFTINGVKQTVTVDGAALDYLISSNPKADLSLHTIGDYTFIANKAVTIQDSGVDTPAAEAHCLINCKRGNYGHTYSIEIDGVEKASYTTANGGSAADSITITSTNISNNLLSDLNANLGSTDWLVIQYGTSIYVKNKNGTAFTVAAFDGADGSDLVAVSDHVEEFKDLPARAPEGYIVQITGNDKSEFNNYYLKYDNPDGGNVVGQWKECVAPGVRTGFDLATMPHVLVRTDLGQFTLRQAEWADRQVGDDDTVPMPSFIGQQVNDIGSFQERLAFQAGENLVATRTSEWFDFFKGSATVDSDDDPIDRASNANEVAILRSMVPFQDDLVMFADKMQFVIDGSKPVTNASLALNPTSYYESEQAAKPVASGNSIFFAINYGAFTGIREFMVDSVTDTNSALPVTGHVTKYLRGKVTDMESSTNLEMLFVLTDGAPNEVYVHEFYWQADQKVQSSWHKWTLSADAEVLSVNLDGTKLYMTVNDGADTLVVYIDLADVDDTGLTFASRIDKKVELTAYEESGDYFVDLPYTPTEALVFVRGEGDSHPGLLFNAELVSGSKYRLPGCKGVCTVIVGQEFEGDYEMSNPTVKDGNDKVITTSRLQWGTLQVNFEDTGYFVVEVENLDRPGEPPFTTVFNGRVVGSADTRIGETNIQDGSLVVPIRARADRVKVRFKSKSYLPLNILDLEWTGQFNKRGTRV